MEEGTSVEPGVPANFDEAIRQRIAQDAYGAERGYMPPAERPHGNGMTR